MTDVMTWLAKRVFFPLWEINDGAHRHRQRPDTFPHHQRRQRGGRQQRHQAVHVQSDLSAVSGRTVTVNYATANGTATAGTTGSADYVAASGTLTFNPGTTTQDINVTVRGDTTVEANETFFVNLSGATNASIADSQGVGTIQNDDLPALSINDVSVIEGNSGSVNATFTVTLSPAASQTVTVSHATANGTATAGSDYTATSGTLSFTPGATTRTFTVPVLGDVLDEDNETFVVNLSNPSANATISDAQGVGTIVDNAPTPWLVINNVSVTEGNSGSVTATFTVTLSAASGRNVTVNYATANGTATAGSDNTATSGTLTFTPGATTRSIAVAVPGDVFDENDETLFVNLSGAVNATISNNQGQATIVDNHPTPSLVINNVTATEGNSGTRQFIFTVTL